MMNTAPSGTMVATDATRVLNISPPVDSARITSGPTLK